MAAFALLLAAAGVDFARQVEPILRARCYACHGAQTQQKGLRLDRSADAWRGSSAGPVILPGRGAASKLIQLVSGLPDGKVMPPVGARLTPGEIAILRTWIDQGASWGPDRRHWAFEPVRSGPGGSIDRFVRDRLRSEGIQPSPEADRVTLVRRLSLDLTGLPPTPEETVAFLGDTRPDAYERVVDRLLASPHYGEKWARYWLDLARYADSDGYESDLPRPHAWRWRHWVIDAFNRDLPFDQFTLEQLAGDLLPGATVEQRVAPGFHRNTLTNREGGVDTEQWRIEQVLDRTNTFGTVWLGLTVGCAQCHDHKYDPISQQEYYRLFAFFNTAHEADIDAPLPGEMGPYLARRPGYAAQRQALLEEYRIPELQVEWERLLLHAADHPGESAAWDRAWKFFGNNTNGGQAVLRLDPGLRTPQQRDQLADYLIARFNEGFGRDRLKEHRIEELRKKLAELNAAAPALSQAPTLAEFGTPRASYILLRGDFRQRGEEVRPGTPAALHPLPPDPQPSRLTLARWVTAPDNPLTARVTVNRLWQELFGRGLVRTSEDFGTQGERPTHPELLDWLAAEFRARGWSMKQMIRLLVMSDTYRQSSRVRPELLSRDPDNTLLARQARLRLPAELVRDSALFAAGLLDTSLGGRSIRPPLPAGVAALGYAGGIKWVETPGPQLYRRGLYIHFQRTVPYPQLMNFDAPDGYLACSRRPRSNTPLQALNLLNDPVFFEAAQGLALRILREAPPGVERRLRHGFQLCLARPPTARETEKMASYFDRQIALLRREPGAARALFPLALDGVEPTEAAAWTAASRILLNLDEFLTRE